MPKQEAKMLNHATMLLLIFLKISTMKHTLTPDDVKNAQKALSRTTLVSSIILSR